jgi:HAD superfamily hydrolase (TIGR01509 family)
MQKTTLFWDNDGVLVDTETLYFQANRTVFKSVGFDLDPEQFREFYLKQSGGAWHLALANGLPAADVEPLRDRRNRLYAQLLGTAELAMAGAADCLQALAGRFVTGVVTSSRRDHFDLIHSRTGLRRFFDFVVTGDDVAHTKPSPEPYLKALELSGRLPAECLAIEDSERGLTAAKAAGLECWVVPNALTRNGDFRPADRVLASLAEVAAELGQR